MKTMFYTIKTSIVCLLADTCYISLKFRKIILKREQNTTKFKTIKPEKN